MRYHNSKQSLNIQVFGDCSHSRVFYLFHRNPYYTNKKQKIELYAVKSMISI